MGGKRWVNDKIMFPFCFAVLTEIGYDVVDIAYKNN